MEQIKYTVLSSNNGWYAQTDCDCGSTLSCGDWQPSIEDAIIECCASAEHHLNQGNKKCGIKSHQQKTLADILEGANQ